MKSQKKEKALALFMFMGLVVGMFFALNMQDYLFLRPQGRHQFRQTDCTSFALMYAHHENGLLDAELHQLMSDGGTTGKTAGELPLLYFVVGKLWKLTGQQEWLFRVINFFIFTLGLFALYNITLTETRSYTSSLLLVAMLFTVPIFLFYAPNFLQNTTAFSLVLMGWYYVHRFYKSNAWLHGIMATVFFTLAPLLKITALISVLALLGVLLMARFWPTKAGNLQLTKRQTLLALLGGVFSIGSTAGWYVYAKNYVADHGGWYTHNAIWPIWNMDMGYIKETLHWVFSVWVEHYFSTAGYLFLALSVLIIFIYRKQMPQFLWWLMGIVLLGNVIYLLLWFNALHDHDYYLINLYTLPVLLWFSALYMLKENVIKSVPSEIIGLCVSIVLVYASIHYGKFNLWYRYAGWMNDNGTNRYASFFDVTPYLREELAIDKDVPVLTYPDPSFSITLYLADQRGWPIRDNWPIDSIAKRINLGARYILVNDSAFYDKKGLEAFNLEPVGHHRNIDVLKINTRPTRR